MLAAARLWLLAALPALAGYGWEALGEVVNVSGPAFAPGQRGAVLAAVGQTAQLDCRVLRLGDKSVSWVRSRDLQILSHAGVVFTADARVSAAETRGGGVAGSVAGSGHALCIERLRAEDAGRYECQVNTDPKLSLFFNLTVIDEAMPEVSVSALVSHVVRGRLGGAATLACEARYSPPPRALPLPPLALLWRKQGDATPLSLQSARGGVSLDTERWARARVVSRLTLAALGRGDAGRYECVAGEASDTVTLLLEEDEEGVEAMQRDQSPLSVSCAPRPAPAPAPVAALLALLFHRALGNR